MPKSPIAESNSSRSSARLACINRAFTTSRATWAWVTGESMVRPIANTQRGRRWAWSSLRKPSLYSAKIASIGARSALSGSLSQASIDLPRLACVSRNGRRSLSNIGREDWFEFGPELAESVEVERRRILCGRRQFEEFGHVKRRSFNQLGAFSTAPGRRGFDALVCPDADCRHESPGQQAAMANFKAGGAIR